MRLLTSEPEEREGATGPEIGGGHTLSRAILSRRRGRGERRSWPLENADWEVTAGGEGLRRFFYVTQSSTLPNDPNLFRGATTAVVVDVARNHAGGKIGNSFPGDWNDRKECGAGSPPLSNLLHPHSRMGDINFIAKSNSRCIASSGSSCCDFRRENPHFLDKIYEKRCNDGNC